MSSTASDALAAWTVGFKLDDSPALARDEARKALFNSIVTAVAGHHIDHTQRALAYARSEGQGGSAHVLVSGEALSVTSAAFVNAVMVNALGQEETHLQSGTHPAETTIPIALAEAEAVGASGKALLEAFIVGMQVSGAVGRMSLVWRGRELLAQPPSAFGAIGAAAAAAKLRGLDAEQTSRAIGLAAMFTAAPAESMRAGTGEYHYLKAWAAAHAHAAVMLALEGAPVAPSALDGPAGFYRIWANIPFAELQTVDVAAELRHSVARDWVAPELIFKRYPVNYFNQPFIDSAAFLRKRHGIRPDEVRSIRLRLGAHPAKVGGLGQAPFERRSSAMMSTRFGVACMLARGQVQLSDTLDPGGADIRRLADLTEVDVDPNDDNFVGIEIVTDRGVFDGSNLSEFKSYRLTMAEIREIGHPLVARRIGEAKATALLERLEGVEQLGSASELVAATWGDQ